MFPGGASPHISERGETIPQSICQSLTDPAASNFTLDNTLGVRTFLPPDPGIVFACTELTSRLSNHSQENCIMKRLALVAAVLALAACSGNKDNASTTDSGTAGTMSTDTSGMKMDT